MKGISRFAARGICFLALAAAVSVLPGAARAANSATDALAQGFKQPPDSAKPHTWWHWMNGNVTREGITRDLEAMKQVGLGGAQMFDVNDGIPAGPVKYMSPEWRGMIKHAVSEANRLGLELCIHNCGGWSSSGGPWNTPEHAMQVVVWREQRAHGPMRLDTQLPQPDTRLNCYRDIAVLAFPTPAAEKTQMADAQPTVTASVPAFDGTKLWDGNRSTGTWLPLPRNGAPQYIQFQFAQPFRARALTLIPGSGRNSHQGELQISDDGVQFRTISNFTIPNAESASQLALSFAPVTARYYRLSFTRADSRARRMSFNEIELRSDLRLDNWAGKADFQRGEKPMPAKIADAESDMVIPRAQILDLSARTTSDGRLTWDVPAGDWTILRFGYTPTGKGNHPAQASGTGPECDKLSREAVAAHWDGMMAKVLADVGPLAGKTLNNVLVDSYEVGSQNWTPRMRQEFQQRRGYDLLNYLPVMTGRVVESPEISERFLWDLRRTVADLYTDNYYGYFRELSHQHGLLFSTEPYGNGPFNELDSGGKADIPMSEFWAGQGNDNTNSKLASSIAHIYGRKYVGAESFTAAPAQAGWRNYPYAMKMLGDFIYCGGVNRFIFHRYAHQPWLDRKPGMTMGQWGFHFDRTNTWWNQAPAWLSYLTRCQYLLQSGHFAADLCYFVGEDSPASLPGRNALNPAPPAGYDYDGCNAEILAGMTVKDGKLVLPSGMVYRALVLPAQTRMTPALLRTIRDLVQAGATVIGPRPENSPSLQGYPQCDAEVRELADTLWGNCDGRKVTSHAFGKGKVYWGAPLTRILTAKNIAPDFEAATGSKDAHLAWIHRRVGATDIYFVSNQQDSAREVECLFRVSGKAPELWHPDSGRMEAAPVYRATGGRTAVRLVFDPAGSVFVVFRRPAKPAAAIASIRRNGGELCHQQAKPAGKLAIRQAIYGSFATAPTDTVDVTKQLAAQVHDGRLSVVAGNDLAGDPALNVEKQLRVEYVWNGQARVKTVDENTRLTLPEPGPNGEPQPAGNLQIRKATYGVLHEEEPAATTTTTVDVTAQVASRVHNNVLRVKADNTLGGDPASMIVKEMRVDYTLNGKDYSVSVPENATLELPSGGVSMTVAADVCLNVAGKPLLEAREPGRYEIVNGAGRRVQINVPRVPAPVTINGPWLVRFPAGLGAPSSATLERLESWTQNADPGVRYFSGTATYVKEFILPNSLFTGDRVFNLDLGAVKYFAQVKLNGKDLGIFWKPPFRTAVNGILHPGKNTLEVQITNLWGNRLIGDEQLPDDREWTSGNSLRGWPAWMREGKPMPQTGRITWTTWHHYTKDSPLQESGLLGPVQVQVEVVKPIKLQ